MSTNGVVIPQATIQDSEQKKRQHRTLRQMPIYRDIANLKYFVVCLYERVPRKFTRYIDSILLTASEAKKELTYWDCKRIEQVMNSYFGFCQRKRTYRFRKSIINMMGDVFWKYFYVEGHYESIHMKNEYKLNF